MAVVMLLAIPVQLGLPQFIVRHCALYLYRRDFELMKGLLRRANQTVLTLGLMLTAVAIFVVDRWIPASGAIAPGVLAWALILLPVIGLSAIRSAALCGLGRVVLGQMPEMALRPLLLVLLLGVSALYGWQLVPLQAIWFQLAATFLAFMAGAFLLRWARPNELKKATPQFGDRHWMMGALPFAALAGAYVVTQQTDVVMLGLFTGAADVGVYRVVTQVAPLVIFGASAINATIAPHLTQLYDAKDQHNLQRVVTHTARGALLLAVPIALVFIVAGGWLLRIVFGSAFGVGHQALTITAIGYVISTGMGPVGYILNMTGHVWYSMAGIAVAALTNVILNLLFIPAWGMEGAAIATLLSLLLWKGLLAYWVYRQTGLGSAAYSWRPAKGL